MDIPFLLEPQDEERLYQVLKAYIEEWGLANVIVAVPQCWSKFADQINIGVQVEFTTIDIVSVRVQYSPVRLAYDVTLRPA